MLFNSFEFLLFLPLVFLLYWSFSGSKRAQWQNAAQLSRSGEPGKKKSRIYLLFNLILNIGILEYRKDHRLVEKYPDK